MSDYEKEFRIIDNKIEMSFSKPYESAYGASVKLSADEARNVARNLEYYADQLELSSKNKGGE